MKKTFLYLISSLFFLLNLNTKVYSATEDFFTKVNIKGGEIHYIDICASNQNIIYAGSQEGGLWVSKDGGQTWTETNFFKTANAGTNVFAVHSQQPNIIIAAAIKPASPYAGFYTGLYRSENYGESWTPIPMGVGEFTKILNSKKNPDEFYLLAHSGPQSPSICKSTDKGITWTTLSRDATHSGFDNKPGIDMALDNNNNLFVTAVDMTPPIGKQKGFWLGNRQIQLGEALFGNIFVSTDDVKTFSYVAIATASFQTSPFGYQFSKPAPWSISSGSNTVAFACVTYSTFTDSKYYAIYVATSTQESEWGENNKTYYTPAAFVDDWWNKGIKFTKISTSVVVDVGFAMAVSPDGQKIYFYDPQKRKVLISTFSATSGFGEFFDWSTGFLDGSNQIQANDFVIAPQNPNKMFIADQSRYGVIMSTDSGKTWSPTNNGMNALIVYDGCKSPDGTLYVLSKMAVYKSVDGTNWTEVFSTVTTQGNALEFDEGTAVSPKENVVIVSADGYVYRSENGGSSWSLVLGSSLPVAKSIVFRSDNSGVGYIAFREPNPGEIPGYKTDRNYIYKTTDWGKTWAPINFKSMSVQLLTLDPKQQNVLYIGLGEISYWEERTYTFGGFKKITDNDDGTVAVEDIISEATGDFTTKVAINPDDPQKMVGSIITKTSDPMGTTDIYGSFKVSYNGGKDWGIFNITYPIEPGEFQPGWMHGIYDIKYSSGIVYWTTSDGIFALIDNTNEVKWLAKTKEIGTTKCLILGSLYTGTSTGLYKLTRLPSQLNIQLDTPRVYGYPNPFDLSKGQKVTIKYLVPQGKEVNWLKISIYSLSGELIYEFPEDKTTLQGGFGYYYEWDGKNHAGKTCSRGIYIVLFKSNLGITKTKIIMIK